MILDFLVKVLMKIKLKSREAYAHRGQQSQAAAAAAQRPQVMEPPGSWLALWRGQEQLSVVTVEERKATPTCFLLRCRGREGCVDLVAGTGQG